MNILGISAFYHDSAAALVCDGRIVAAAQEERFTRKKHDVDFPAHAVAYCLEAGGITTDAIDLVVFYEKPLLRFERLLETYIAYAPRGFRQFLMSIPLWLRQKLHLPARSTRPWEVDTRAGTSSSSTTNRTRPAPSFPAPSRRPRS